MHFNISVHSIEVKNNMDGNSTEKDGGAGAAAGGAAGGKDMTDTFMAGILKYIREITLFLNPVSASYARFGQMEAPRYVSWAVQNRSQLIRIPADPSGRRRIELRSPDPEANPYLAYALLIRAGLRGITEGLRAPLPMDINVYKAEAAVTDQLKRLPGSLAEAVVLAEKSAFVKEYVPEECLLAYLNR